MSEDSETPLPKVQYDPELADTTGFDMPVWALITIITFVLFGCAWLIRVSL